MVKTTKKSKDEMAAEEANDRRDAAPAPRAKKAKVHAMKQEPDILVKTEDLGVVILESEEDGDVEDSDHDAPKKHKKRKRITKRDLPPPIGRDKKIWCGSILGKLKKKGLSATRNRS